MSVHIPSSFEDAPEPRLSPRAVLGFYCGDLDSPYAPLWLSKLELNVTFVFRHEMATLLRKLYTLAFLQPNLRTVRHSVWFNCQ